MNWSLGLQVSVIRKWKGCSKASKIFYVCTLANSGFLKNFFIQGGVKSTVSLVFEDLNFKISEGYDQNWCFPDSAQLAVSAKSGKHQFGSSTTPVREHPLMTSLFWVGR